MLRAPSGGRAGAGRWNPGPFGKTIFFPERTLVRALRIGSM